MTLKCWKQSGNVDPDLLLCLLIKATDDFVGVVIDDNTLQCLWHIDCVKMVVNSKSFDCGVSPEPLIAAGQSIVQAIQNVNGFGGSHCGIDRGFEGAVPF